MTIYYKKQTNLIKYLESVTDVKIYKDGGFLKKIGLKKTVYPDIYFHSGSLNTFSIRLIKYSKIVIVNSNILKDKIVKQFNVEKDKINVILPACETKKYKKKELQNIFKEKHNIEKNKKIIYFTAKDFSKNGFVKFCNILQNLEMENWKAVVSTNIDKEIVYANEILEHHKLTKDVIVVKNEIFEIADIFVLPTILENFAYSVLKAMANKCVVFTTTNNNAIEILDVFGIMDGPNDSNLSYKIDMLLRVKSEFKKIKKENYKIASKLTYEYQKEKLNTIIKRFTSNS